MAVFADSAVSDELTGRIFNIQRCSVHDGPGIRTSVFLKGCPLSCTWCHNPEGIDETPELMLSVDRCLSCGACSEVCPIGEGGAAAVGVPWDRNLCIGCGTCVEACPADARELAGYDIRVRDLIDELERDRIFFERSGGGVTFSGGEPLAQPGFLVACLSECRLRSLHAAVDTCGLASRQILLEIAGLADLVLFDLKHLDPARHRAETGVDNRLILENLRALSGRDTEIWIRLPLIPGFNDDSTNIEATAEFLESLPRRHRAFVLPYHGIANGKRTRLEDVGHRTDVPTSDAAVLGSVTEIFARHDLDVTVGGSP
jgi:pyruvate formate lyase activating enzyme